MFFSIFKGYCGVVIVMVESIVTTNSYSNYIVRGSLFKYWLLKLSFSQK